MTPTRLKSPLYAQMELTFACNLACNHCYNEPRFSNVDGLVQLKRVKKEKEGRDQFVAIAQELADNDIFSVSLTGGEVFTVRDRLFSCLEALVQNNVDVTINSNATLVSDDDAKKLKDNGVVAVMTSLISYDPETHDAVAGRKGAHAMTLRGIERLQNAGVYVAVNMVVSKQNLDHVFTTGAFVHDLGVQSFSTAQAVPSSSGGAMHLEHALTSEEVVHYLEDLHQVRLKTGMHIRLTNPLPYCRVWESHPHLRYIVESASCTAGRSIIQIDPSGNVKPCPMVSKSYGNIVTEGLAEVWGRMSEWDENQYVPETCKPCDLVSICRGACRAEAERMVGSLDSKHPYSVQPVTSGMPKTGGHHDVFSAGQRVYAVEGIKARKENEQLYILYATGDRYLFAGANTAKIVAAIQRNNGITVDEKIMRSHELVHTLSQGLQSGILIKAA